MKKYIFVTPEGLTYKPNIDRPEPDFPELQIIDYGYSVTVSDALQGLIESTHNLSVRLETDNKNSIWLKERRTRACIAS